MPHFKTLKIRISNVLCQFRGRLAENFGSQSSKCVFLTEPERVFPLIITTIHSAFSNETSCIAIDAYMETALSVNEVVGTSQLSIELLSARENSLPMYSPDFDDLLW